MFKTEGAGIFRQYVAAVTGNFGSKTLQNIIQEVLEEQLCQTSR